MICTFIIRTSGTAVTPNGFNSRSPMLLVIANRPFTRPLPDESIMISPCDCSTRFCGTNIK